MVPLDIDGEGIKAFALSQNQSFCCFGVTPALNEMVLVTMAGPARAPFRLELAVACSACDLAVGEETEGGEVTSLYRMSAGRVLSMEELLRYAQGSRGGKSP
jgi:hypothetical protein